MTVGSQMRYPYHLNGIFVTYAGKDRGIDYAIPIIQKIIDNDNFKKDPQSYMRKWKIDHPVNFYDESRDLYGFSPHVPVVVKAIEAYIKDNQQIIAQLEQKREIYKHAYKLLCDIKNDIQQKHPQAYTSEILTEYVNILAHTEKRSTAEEKVYNLLKNELPLK